MPQPPVASFARSPRYVLLVVDDGTAAAVGLVKQAIAEVALPAEVIACVSADEAVARLRCGRRYSAIIAGAAQPGIEELRSDAQRVATPIITLERGLGSGSGAALIAAVTARAMPVRQGDRPRGGQGLAPSDWTDPASIDRHPRSHLVAVCGPGGTGASVIAAALAAYLAARPISRDVLLADFALRSDQAALHHLPEQPTSLLDLIAQCRHRRPEPTQLRQSTSEGPGYRLLIGLGRPSHWTAVTPAAFDAVLSGLCAAFDVIVADVAGEFEGELEVGSIDIQERNHMARQVTVEADAVIVIGRPGRAGARRLAMTIDALLDRGVDQGRIQPVVNRVTGPGGHPPMAPTGASRTDRLMAMSIRVPELTGLDGVPFPDHRLAGALGALVAARLRERPAPLPRSAPIPVVTGSIGCWQGSQPA